MDFVYLSRARNLASHSVTRAHIHTHAQWTQALNTVTLECWQSVVFFACNIVSCLASQLLFYTSHMWESVGRSVARFLFYTFALTYNTQQKSKSNMLCLCNFLILSRFIRARVCVYYIYGLLIWYRSNVWMCESVSVCMTLFQLLPFQMRVLVRHFSQPVNLYLSFTLASSSGWTDERDVSERMPCNLFALSCIIFNGIFGVLSVRMRRCVCQYTWEVTETKRGQEIEKEVCKSMIVDC